MAVPRENLSAVEKILRAAKLKPVTFGLGIGSVQPPSGESRRVITLLVRNSTIDLQVSGGGGIVALRSLDGAIEVQGAMKRISSEMVAREIRITLGQLPAPLGEGAGKIRIVGQGEITRQFVREISPRLAAMSLTVEAAEKACDGHFDKPLPAELAASPVVALAAAWVRGAETTPEFLPPKVQPWQQWVSKGLSTRKLIWMGEAAAAVVCCAMLAFGIQQWQLASLRGKWAKMKPQVTELTAMQEQIRQFRDYYDAAQHNVGIWARLATLLPRDSSVSLKTLEIRDQGNVTCTGVARDNASFERAFVNISDATNEICNVHPEVHGQKPIGFTLSFQWLGGGANGN
jgi:hypothetical protein